MIRYVLEYARLKFIRRTLFIQLFRGPRLSLSLSECVAPVLLALDVIRSVPETADPLFYEKEGAFAYFALLAIRQPRMRRKEKEEDGAQKFP